MWSIVRVFFPAHAEVGLERRHLEVDVTECSSRALLQ
jgi:hypothetical protein